MNPIQKTALIAVLWIFLASLIGCCSPTVFEERSNQTWETIYQEHFDNKKKVKTPQDAINLLRLALQTKGITYRPHNFNNMPRWKEAVYGAFLKMPYPMINSTHQKTIEQLMEQLGYKNKGMFSKREIDPKDQTKILEEFARLLGVPFSANQPTTP